MVRTPLPEVDPVLADLRERGYGVTRLDGSDSPAAVATGGTAPGAVTDRPLAVEPIRTGDPLTVVARLASAAERGQAALLVADEETAVAARSVLEPPFLLRAERDGCRAFYVIPDRIRVPEGGYACARTDGDPAWREEPATGGVTGDGDPTPRLLLEADGRVLAAFDSTDALTCPGPTAEAFPYRYERGTDKRVHVFDGDREVGRYAGVAPMKANAYRPVPLPLFPEHHLRKNRYLARRWTVAVPGDAVDYDTA